jgi:transposase
MEANEELAEIQREFERIRASTGKPIFPAPLRARAVAWCNARKAEGRSVEQICRTLGIGSNTLRSWLKEKHSVSKAKRSTSTPTRSFVPVAVAASPSPPVRESNFCVSGPGGIRIEGLDVASLAELLRRLS